MSGAAPAVVCARDLGFMTPYLFLRWVALHAPPHFLNATGVWCKGFTLPCPHNELPSLIFKGDTRVGPYSRMCWEFESCSIEAGGGPITGEHVAAKGQSLWGSSS